MKLSDACRRRRWPSHLCDYAIRTAWHNCKSQKWNGRSSSAYRSRRPPVCVLRAGILITTHRKMFFASKCVKTSAVGRRSSRRSAQPLDCRSWLVGCWWTQQRNQCVVLSAATVNSSAMQCNGVSTLATVIVQYSAAATRLRVEFSVIAIKYDSTQC